MVIVIDALDECKDEEPVSTILSVLGQFVAQVPKVKFFITGRPEPRIRDGFRLPLLAEATVVFLLHEVEPSQIHNDTSLFFRHSFSEIKSRRHGLDGWPTKEQLDLLCERAGGLFVHAIATVRFVDQKNNSPKKQLDRLLQSQGSSAFEGRPNSRPTQHSTRSTHQFFSRLSVMMTQRTILESGPFSVLLSLPRTLSLQQPSLHSWASIPMKCFQSYPQSTRSSFFRKTLNALFDPSTSRSPTSSSIRPDAPIQGSGSLLLTNTWKFFPAASRQ